MHKLFTTILIILAAASSYSQISVASFDRIDNDLTARVDAPVRDQNGDVCALIKIETNQTGFTFEAAGLGIMKTERKTGEYWVYIPWGSRRLTIKHDQLGILRDYVYPESIEKATVYVMKLTTARVTTIVEEPKISTEWVVIKSEPEGAQVFINDRPVGRTPYSHEFNLGRYNYRVEMPMYHSEAGVFTLSADAGRHNIDLTLKPAFGSIKVSSEPESGANILINGDPTGQKTPFTLENIRSGTHTITIKKDMYYDAYQEIVVEDSKTAQVNLKMNPAYGVLNIYTSPEADIFINTQKEGHGTHTARKLTGFYTVEARKDKHTPDSKRIEVKDGDEITVNLNPSPQYGQLRIATTPSDAEIYLDGKKMGITPITLREILIGDYNLELRKTGYASYTQNIKIKHNETTDINETLSDGIEITITSEPAGAKIEIDGKDMGVTPFKGMLGFGSHNVKLTNNQKIVNERINVTQEGKTRWEFDAREGVEVTFLSTPSRSKILIDGKKIGRTPITYHLTQGKSTIKLNRFHNSISKEINTDNIKSNELHFDIPKNKSFSPYIGYSLSETALIGLEIGYVNFIKSYGMYISLLSNGRVPIKTIDNRSFSDDVVYTYTGKLRKERLSILIGSGVYGDPTDFPLLAYCGVGYGLRNLMWYANKYETTSNFESKVGEEWVKVYQSSVNGIELEGGFGYILNEMLRECSKTCVIFINHCFLLRKA
jgi:hypothetical protein